METNQAMWEYKRRWEETERKLTKLQTQVHMNAQDAVLFLNRPQPRVDQAIAMLEKVLQQVEASRK